MASCFFSQSDDRRPRNLKRRVKDCVKTWAKKIKSKWRKRRDDEGSDGTPGFFLPGDDHMYKEILERHRAWREEIEEERNRHRSKKQDEQEKENEQVVLENEDVYGFVRETDDSEDDGDSWHTATFLDDDDIAVLEAHRILFEH